MEHLNALASICESAERMPVVSGLETTEKILKQNPQAPILSPPDHLLKSYYNPTLPLLCNTPSQYIPTIATGTYLTPPITPASYIQQPTETNDTIGTNPLSLSLQYTSTRPSNPVMRNIISYASYLQYLDETWPEKCSRRGSAVIRNSLYIQIADCLKGGASTARFRYWVRKSGFFLLEKQQTDGSYEMRIAVSFHPKSHASNNSKKKSSPLVKEYRLVAKLEEFLPLIGEYHNDVIGHYGIRKTYQMIQQDYTYLPRSAIAKFVQLCDVCSVRGKRVTRQKQTVNTSSQEEEEEEESEDNFMFLQNVSCPEGGEIEVATESAVSSSSSLQNEDSTLSVKPTTSSLIKKETKTATIKKDDEKSVQEEAIVPHSKEESVTEIKEEEEATDPSHQELYTQIHESVKNILEGLTWEEMLQVFSEATNSSIMTSSNILESMLRM